MLIDRIGRYIEHRGLVRPGDLVLAGVSGGPDSVFLMHALHRLRTRLGARLHVVHLNHGLRGAEADAEADFTVKAAAALGLPVTAEKRAVPKAGADGLSPQERARAVRLAFFADMRERLGAARVALGHTADDQAETILLRFLGGGGPGSLGGIRPRGPGGIIHPLLCVDREEIERFLAEEGLPFRTDTSNLEGKYRRNRVRQELMPLVKMLNPAFLRRAAVLGGLLAEDDDRLVEEARSLVGEVAAGAGPKVRLGLAGLMAAPPALRRRMIVLAARRAGTRRKDLGAVHVESLMDLAAGPSGRSVALPGRLRAVRTGTALVIGPPPAPRPDFEREVSLPGTTEVPELGIRIEAAAAGPPAPDRLAGPPTQVYLDAGRIVGRVRVRPRRPGDRFIPLGLPGPTKVKDFLIGAGVERDRRDRLPVFHDDEKIIWLGGLRLDERVRITAETKSAWRLSISWGEKGDEHAGAA